MCNQVEYTMKSDPYDPEYYPFGGGTEYEDVWNYENHDPDDDIYYEDYVN